MTQQHRTANICIVPNADCILRFQEIQDHPACKHKSCFLLSSDGTFTGEYHQTSKFVNIGGEMLLECAY